MLKGGVIMMFKILNRQELLEVLQVQQHRALGANPADIRCAAVVSLA